jgi:hypothetical protein
MADNITAISEPIVWNPSLYVFEVVVLTNSLNLISYNITIGGEALMLKKIEYHLILPFGI